MNRVMVVGDIMLDHYIFGTANRISPEAPVPIINFEREELTLGGAGNVALNLFNLGFPKPVLCGFLGYDKDGQAVTDILKKIQLPTGGIHFFSDGITTRKVRVIGNNQQTIRIDYEKHFDLNPIVFESFYNYLVKRLDKADIIIISDYGKGVITPHIIQFILEKKGPNTKVICDSKTSNLMYCKNVYCITPNKMEAEKFCGFQIDSKESLHKALDLLSTSLGPEIAMITLGANGIAYQAKFGLPHHYKIESRSVYDVTGAGDVVVAIMAYSILMDLKVSEAIRMANLAGSIVVGKIGTSRVSIKEIEREQRGVPNDEETESS